MAHETRGDRRTGALGALGERDRRLRRVERVFVGLCGSDLLDRLHRPRARRHEGRDRRLREDAPGHPREGRRRDLRRQDRRRDPRRQRAGRGALLRRGRLHRRLLLERSLDRPRRLHEAGRSERRRLPRGAAPVLPVRGHPLRAPHARGRLRPLLQQGPLREGRHRRPAANRVAAHGRREEAHRAEPGRVAQGRRPRSLRRLLRERRRTLGAAVGRRLGRRVGQVEPGRPARAGRTCFAGRRSSSTGTATTTSSAGRRAPATSSRPRTPSSAASSP